MKKSKQDDVDLDDSSYLFKPVKIKHKAKSTSAEEPQASSIVTTFIDSNVASTSNGLVKKSKEKSKTTKTTTRKTKTKSKSGDIRKNLTKSERVFHQIIENECRENGLDPEEMQIALAISESLKDQQPDNGDDSGQAKKLKLENPFKVPSGNFKSITAKLEQFGFKSQRKLTDFELELLANSKFSKRSKFTRFPTVLTKTSHEMRMKTTIVKIDRLLDRSFRPDPVNCNDDKFRYEVSSASLQDMQCHIKSIFEMNSESRPTEDILINYYVTDLFEPSLVPADHLLKDWRDVPGREQTPERTVTVEIEKLEQKMSNDDIEFEMVTNGSCLDIFGDDNEDENVRSDDSFCPDQTLNIIKNSSNELAEQLEVLHASLSQDDVFVDQIEGGDEKNQESVSDMSSKTILCFDPENEEENIVDCIDLTQIPVSSSIIHNSQQSSLHNTAEIDLTQEDEDEIVNTSRDGKYLGNLENIWLNEANEYPEIDLTQNESNDISIPFDDSLHTLKRNLQNILRTSQIPSLDEEGEEANIQVISSEEMVANNEIENAQNIENEKINDHELETNEQHFSQQSSTFDDDDMADVISISDEEINYSTRNCQNANESGEDGVELNDDDLQLHDFPIEHFEDPPPHMDVEVIEDENLIDLTQTGDYCINDTVTNLLEKSIVSSMNHNTSIKSDKLAQPLSNDFSDSIKEIMMKYGGVEKCVSSPKLFKKFQSESMLKPARKSVQFMIDEVHEDNLDLNLDGSLKENSANNFNLSIHQSLENLCEISSQVSQSRPKNDTPKSTKSSVKISNQKKVVNLTEDKDYLIDITTRVLSEPDFESMTPVELKQALFKYGIRALPTKKAITILNFIYDRIHPKITSNIEVDVDDSRRQMNMTDIISNIGYQDNDDFPFHPEIVEDEEIVLPNQPRKKIPTCLIPLHISFYNMVRSSEKIQRYILEYRPVELDQIYKHFRKFGLTYEMNEIIAFLDRRCITFKTKEKSLAKTHEKKLAARSKKKKR